MLDENAKDQVNLTTLETKWVESKEQMTQSEKDERLRLTRVIEARSARLAKKYDEEFYLEVI